jgi:hypothetical protein
VDKETLLDRIRTSRRQLERYLFYFEKDEEGVFSASKRPKFGEEEMVQPGLAGDWSVRDLLAHLIDREERLLPWLVAAREGKTPEARLPYLKPHVEPPYTGTAAASDASSIDELLAEFQRSHQRLDAILATVPEYILFAAGYFPGTDEATLAQATAAATLAQATAAATYEPYEWAKDRLRRWRKTRPTRYLDKEEILARIRTERRRLEQNLVLLDEAQLIRPGVVGDWSVKDILAHLADWERRFLLWYQAGQRGEVPEIPAPGLSWAQLDLLNQRIYEANRDRPLAEVLATFRRSYRDTITAIEAIPEEEIFAAGRYAWVGVDNNLVDVILANTANHYRWAKTAIRAWMKEANGRP